MGFYLLDLDGCDLLIVDLKLNEDICGKSIAPAPIILPAVATDGNRTGATTEVAPAPHAVN